MRAKLEADAKGGPTPLISPGGLIQLPTGCGIGSRSAGNAYFLVSKGTTIASFAMHLTVLLGQPVEDQTGIRGYFGLNLEVAEDQIPMFRQSVAPSSIGGRSIETAIGDDLNLSLVGGRVPVQKVVIQHVERPTPD